MEIETNPFEEEIAACEALVSYLKQAGSVPKKEKKEDAAAGAGERVKRPRTTSLCRCGQGRGGARVPCLA